jgi:glycosyltransferase involved in cell wall biosynthesis
MRKKNLQFLLELLNEIQDANISLEIIGPVEDEEYWQKCQALIKRLPENISVESRGALPNSGLLSHLCDNHFFVLPTLSENFGYVFLEALSAGCPLIVSDQIPWHEAEENNVGWLIPLSERQRWLELLKRAAAMNSIEYCEMSARAKSFAEVRLKDPQIEEATVRLFETAAAKKH